MKEFIESYYAQVFSAVTRLTRLNTGQELDALTREILDDLWAKKTTLDAEPRQGVFIYKVVLAHVLAYLKASGQDEKVASLQQILPISPTNYTQLGEDPLSDGNLP